MKKTMVIVIFVIFLCSSINASGIKTDYKKTSSESSDTNYYALIAGVSDYPYQEEEFFDEDAETMYSLLNNSFNWKEENIEFLLNEEATKHNIQEAIINWLDDKETENDVVLIYLSGHGWKIPLLNRAKGNAFFVPYDSPGWNYSEYVITDKELDSWVDELESKNIALIHDHCYAGRMHATSQKGRVILCAGGKYLLCPVDGDETLKHGIFSHYLFEGLMGVADYNNDNWISAEEAFRYAFFPTFHFSLWKHFPFISEWNGKPVLIGPQFPFIYDRHFGSIPLINYC